MRRRISASALLALACKMASSRYALPEDADKQAPASQTTQQNLCLVFFVCEARLSLISLSAF